MEKAGGEQRVQAGAADLQEVAVTWVSVERVEIGVGEASRAQGLNA